MLPQLSFQIYLHEISFFYPYTLDLKWISCRHYFKKQEESQIHNLTLHLKEVEKEWHYLWVFFFFSFIRLLCVFIGAFSLFTFKLIIDRCVLIAILLIVFWLFCSSYLFLSSFVLSSCNLMTSFSVIFIFLSFVWQVFILWLAWSSFITTYEYRSLTWWSG